MWDLARALADEPEHAWRATVSDWPYLGDPPEEGPAISLVGKANYRWPPPTHPDFCGANGDASQISYQGLLDQDTPIDRILEQSRNVGHQFRTERVAGYYSGERKSQRSNEPNPGYYSAWWTFVVESSIGLLNGRSELPRYKQNRAIVDPALASIHTTNLFKVAEVGGNPTDGLPSFQIEHGGRELLQAEFELFDPDLVILPIDESYPTSRKRLFPNW